MHRNPQSTHVTNDVAIDVSYEVSDQAKRRQQSDGYPYSVGPIAVDRANAVPFTKALHGLYSGLNPLEQRFARALDRTQRVWARNPKHSGYYIPLLDMASSSTYWPDFLVWIDKVVVAIDTKGDHLLAEASVSKLFDIDTLGEPPKVVLRLISEGESEALPSGQINRIGKHGFTVWSWKNGRLSGVHASDERSAIQLALDIER